MLRKIHDAHLGIEKCIQRAWELVFWPNMAADIKDVVQKCQIRLEHRNANIRELLQPSEIPDATWDRQPLIYFTGMAETTIVTEKFHNRSYLVLTGDGAKYSSY